MTNRQRRFVEEYCIDLNGTKAAIRAGYSVKSAAEQASELLRNPKVADEITATQEWHATKSGITKNRVLRELAGMAFSDVRNYRLSDAGYLELAPGAPQNAMAAVSGIKRITRVSKDGERTFEVEFKLWGKAEPLKLVGRHVDVKGLADRVEHSGPDGGPIQYEEMSPEERRAKLKEILAAGAERIAKADDPSGS